MNRILKIFVFFALLMTLWACANRRENNIVTTEPVKNEYQETILEEEVHWAFFHVVKNDYRIVKQGYIVFDLDGSEFFRCNYSTPWITFINENLLRADSSGGTEMRHTRFFDVEQGLYSPTYSNVEAVDYGLVVYLEWQFGDLFLVVHDMFDPEVNRNAFQRDFRTGVIGYWPLQETRFVDETTLFIVYYNSEFERVEETLVLQVEELF